MKLSHGLNSYTLNANYKAILVFSLILCLFACAEQKEDTKKVNLATASNTDVQEEEETNSVDIVNESTYTIPSPAEQFDLLQFLGGDLDLSAVHDINAGRNYLTESQQALAFGVYFTDLSYLMRYDKGKKVLLDYIKVLDHLSAELGITKFISEDIITEIESAQDDPDKLIQFTSKNYKKVFNTMVENNKGEALSLILIGGWVQTMHILFETAGDFGNDKWVEKIIVDQEMILDNLQYFIEEYSSNADIKDFLKDFRRIHEAYDRLECKFYDTEVKTEEKNVIILFGGESCNFNQESYDQLKSIIADTRTKII